MTVQSGAKTQRRRNLARREAITFYLCISPWLIGLVLFVLGPMIASAFFSLTRWDLLSAPRFIGLDNYEKLLTRDPLFWQALKVTAIYTLFYVPLDLAGGLALALLVNQKVRGISVFRTFLLPAVGSGGRGLRRPVDVDLQPGGWADQQPAAHGGRPRAALAGRP